MDNDNKISFEIIIATTSQCFEVSDVPLSLTVREVIDKFCEHLNSDSNLGMVWNFVFCGQIVSDKTTLSKLFSKSESRDIQLVAKVIGA